MIIRKLDQVEKTGVDLPGVKGITKQLVLGSSDGVANPLVEGDFAFVAPNEVHQFRNTSRTEAFVFICAVPKEYE